MKILGIESSCDETAAAVVENGRRILSSEVASQVEIHARYGGVVPEVASRQHLLAIVPVIRQAMTKALTDWKDIDAVAVTNGPGLAGSLLVGVSAAKAVAMARGIRLIAVNHLEAHIYANWLGEAEPVFPLLCLIVSGGHTDLVLMRGHGDYTLLGRTLDDAAGEAFDKASRILGLGYPGGPAIDRAALSGEPVINLPRALLPGTHNFSFSGVKTAVYRMVEEGKIDNVNDAAASFRQAVVSVLVDKTIDAAVECGARQILLSGGVAANRLLREQLRQQSPVPVLIPEPSLCTDNAAMTAACGYFHAIAGRFSCPDMDVIPGLRLF
ncbi:MAG: tRNA (adenosine(37)-N6)-threonylcarbamoyltransferase complex transferase subunit TsaD [Dehalococcoidia bacterium]|nr:tRNA (adenosine(37)-N6)-threonylcarbamoyltransferase complex transferase subunit TsaD [Dehalococcoidia bacterium]